jgi:aspartyl-tRNA(Asn)/glutamyl-tRNA(Gln) amidotransferase subunit C
MAHISREEVEHVALLARLQLTEAELDRFTHDLDEILAYVDKLDELDLTGVEPTFHAIPVSDVWRQGDEPQPGLSQEEALANCPEPRPPFFQVPKVADI